MRTVLHVDNLRSHTDVRQLRLSFGRYGVVQRAQVFESPDLFRRHGGFAIVEMESEEMATDAIASLDGAVACGTVVAVRWATALEQTASGHPRMFGPMNVTDANDGNIRP
jgi:RNA recognition motif-containing protein